MLQFYQSRSWKQFFQSPLMAIILFAVVVALMFTVYDRYIIERDMAARRMELEQRYKELEERRRHLAEQVGYLSHERGIEAEIRRNFNVAQEGERVVIILDDDVHNIEPLAPLPPPPPPKPWYRFWE